VTFRHSGIRWIWYAFRAQASGHEAPRADCGRVPGPSLEAEAAVPNHCADWWLLWTANIGRLGLTLERCRLASGTAPDSAWRGPQSCSGRKTVGSEKAMPIDPAVMDALKQWRTGSSFSADTDWVFASAAKIGRLPGCSDSVLRAFQSAGVGHLGRHSLRHSFRSWLQAVGTPVAVQQKLMCHADFRTTMNVYGDTFQPELAEAVSKLAGLVLNGAQAERRPV
jgi:hypothetical protein